MIKTFLAIIFLAITPIIFSQTNIGEINDSTSVTFNFCLIVPERIDGQVILQCSDIIGKDTLASIYMEIREDYFHGKMTIIITPNEDDGPITEDRTINWLLLPENLSEVKTQTF